MSRWEAAYLRFETPDEEVRKFTERFRELGAHAWPRDAFLLDLFSGRGSAETALRHLGFHRITSIDLSERLVRSQANGNGRAIVADCRVLPIQSCQADIAVVQGGLHHLPSLARDVPVVLDEIVRVLRPGGIFAVVEPWETPYLWAAHTVSANPVARRLWGKLDAFATMVEEEGDTYRTWLGSPRFVLQALDARFTRQRCKVRLGKLLYVGRV